MGLALIDPKFELNLSSIPAPVILKQRYVFEGGWAKKVDARNQKVSTKYIT